ncbi:MAG TPA: arsenic resistance N-acetyltransferase ArsN2 [Caldilinea sp.]|nr:arsenic resistance N-acetyltransferase ArsN2 [Caldilinea sp.]
MTSIRTARPDDWPAIAGLLRRYDLPLDGALHHLDSFCVAEDANGEVVGAAAVERYGAAGLLRSIVVAERMHGLGSDLVRWCIDQARAAGITTLVLLTTTAPDFFPRFGFWRTDRASVPAAVHASAEFQGACPASAIVMQLDLGDPVTEG